MRGSIKLPPITMVTFRFVSFVIHACIGLVFSKTKHQIGMKLNMNMYYYYVIVSLVQQIIIQFVSKKDYYYTEGNHIRR